MPKLALGFPGERFIYIPQQVIDSMPYDLFMSDLYVCYLGYFARARYHYYDRPKGCEHHILIHCIDGAGQVVVDGQTYQLCANQFIILPPDVPHHYQADEQNPWTIYWLHFAGDKARMFGQGFDYPHTIPSSHGDRLSQRLNLFEEMYNVLDAGYEKENLRYASSCLWHYLSTFLYSKPFVAAGRRCGEYNESIINRAIYFMNDNIEKTFKVEEFASHIGYTSLRFSRKFKKETGYPPIEYFNMLKMNKACQMLLSTSLTVAQLAYKLGYTDPYYFSRIFTKTIGISPNKFRKENSFDRV